MSTDEGKVVVRRVTLDRFPLVSQIAAWNEMLGWDDTAVWAECDNGVYIGTPPRCGGSQ